MPRDVRPSTPNDLREISGMMAEIFHMEPDRGALTPALMQWKYWAPRSDWSGPRSFVCERGGKIVAHIGVWPVTYQTGGAEIRGVHMLDWVAAPNTAGAGLTLLQHVIDSYDFIWSVGGSDITRQLLPSVGFVPVGSAWIAGRPARPLQQVRTHQHRSWKLGLRYFRNIAWAHKPIVDTGLRWRVAPLDPAAIPTGIVPSAPEEARSSPRGPGFFEYLARCPIGGYRLYGFSDDRGPQGYFVLGVVWGQARIAGIWLRDPTADRWTAAFAHALRTARTVRGAYEVAVAGSSGPTEEAVVRAGFQIIRHAPTALMNKKRKITLPADFQFQMIDDDAALIDAGWSYLT